MPPASRTRAPGGALRPWPISAMVSPVTRMSAESARRARGSSRRPPRMRVAEPVASVMEHLVWGRCGSIREVMKIGFHLTPFWGPTDRPPTRIIDEAIEVVAAASGMGFEWVSIGQHWLSHPTVWPQPMPMLARLAPETGAMRLKTSVLLLPILNAVELAENVATLDHLCHGRLDVG